MAALGVSGQVVTNWKLRGNVPIEYCIPIEIATRSNDLCDAVRCEELRPDVQWGALRNSKPNTTQPQEATQ